MIDHGMEFTNYIRICLFVDEVEALLLVRGGCKAPKKQDAYCCRMMDYRIAIDRSSNAKTQIR